MKKSVKKLVLNRETLYALEENVLREAVGGVSMRTCGDPCTAACTLDPCYGPSDRCTFGFCTK
ncbi:MAG: hypothetical protein QOJ16_4866 [Acidobacteriota bacterium]|jgi:hypothetical protein|nr:hypothetical protein [Acidobacteriota bacterium]